MKRIPSGRKRCSAGPCWCSRWITRVKVSVNAVRGAPAAGRQCALRCEVSMSDEDQTPQSAYHGADLALAQSMAEFRQRPEFADCAPPVARPSFREGHRGIAAQREIRRSRP
jgi:hypothetical protein